MLSDLDLYLRTSQGIKASHQAQQNKPVLETVDNAFQTPHLGRLLRQGREPRGHQCQKRNPVRISFSGSGSSGLASVFALANLFIRSRATCD